MEENHIKSLSEERGRITKWPSEWNPDIRPEELREGELTEIMKKMVVRKKMKMSQRK